MRSATPRSRERAAAERLSLVEAQLLIVITVVVLQLWLLTVALEELLAGHLEGVWSLVACSGIGFLVAALVLAARRERE